MLIPQTDKHFVEFAKTGKYQRPVLDEALKFVFCFNLAIDVGAHVGFWTRALAEKFHEVASFEPVDENFRCLLGNTATLQNVLPFNCALGAKSARCSMKNPAHGNSGAWETTEGTAVNVLTLDRLQFANVGLIKIDVQGDEEKVLRGAVETLRRDKPIVIVECILRGEFDPKPGALLSDLGARQLSRVGKDFIYGW